MDTETRVHGAPWRWPLLLSVIFLHVCLPSLVLSYGVLLVNSVALGVPPWLSLATPATFVLTYGLTQCWCRDAADSWGGMAGYRVMAALGLLLVVASLLSCAFIPCLWHPLAYGVLGGLGSSLISAQVDAVIFETYDSHLALIRGLCFTGQAVGQAIFPHIMSALINSYGFHFSYIVLAGIMLQTLPAIMLLRVSGNIMRPMSFSRYSDLSKTYAIFNNRDANYYSAELQLHDLSKKCWKSPSDDNLHREEELIEVYDDEASATITPPPSPEEKRRNIFGVEIMPEIPEESESEDENEEHTENDKGRSRKKRLSVAIKRLSTMGDNFSEYISKQIRKDSQGSSNNSYNENREYSEVEVTYDNISPVTDVQRERIFNSFSFRCQSAYASMRRRIWMPSYRVYRLKRRMTYFLYNVNDTFIKPLTRSLSCWRFYPSLLLCFSKLSITAIMLVSMPMLASQMHPKISLNESNFLMTLHGFTWVCFLLSTPWLAQTPKRNFKYIAVIGLAISTAACFILAEARNHDMFSIGCVVAGLGYGAITSCWETAIQDFVGARKWPKLHSPLETLSASLLAVFVLGLSFGIKQTNDLQYPMFILGIVLSVVTFIWTILSVISIYVNHVRNWNCGPRCRLQV
ncbi:uncharacterized protein LOC126382362 [Pectinophora gossypiella]|uniref:Major facilitator superfamily (MFS) profile domain-containing protein n=1 Tax=Pectinophora gossypiella TaxID=13191 RepID=A0A1E1W922_PECGO|nr:uncharacterized protein LOC126382362 [Pectinophora gossypiella]